MLLLQLIYLSPAHLAFFKLKIDRPVFPSSFFAKWLFYFFCGILLAKKDQSGQNLAFTTHKSIWPVLLPVISFGFVFAEYLYYNNGQDPGNFDHFHRLTVWLYVLSLIWFIRHFNKQFTNSEWLQKQKSRINYLAGISFTVYIIHTTILRLLPIEFLGIFLRIILAILASFATASLLDKLINSKIPATVRNFLRLAIGLPKS
ncbi:MAG: acyltransferase family protein [Leptonema sp. (in: Bacteria)]|nr:acyltransferase family protein [Leptonema sp. (in: bacteria)]